MTKKRFELRICSNGTYYVYEDGILTDIDFDTFNKDSANAVVDLLNSLQEENEQLKSRIKELEIMNEAQSDAIDGLQETMCHLDLSELNGDVE